MQSEYLHVLSSLCSMHCILKVNWQCNFINVIWSPIKEAHNGMLKIICLANLTSLIYITFCFDFLPRKCTWNLVNVVVYWHGCHRELWVCLDASEAGSTVLWSSLFKALSLLATCRYLTSLKGAYAAVSCPTSPFGINVFYYIKIWLLSADTVAQIWTFASSRTHHFPLTPYIYISYQDIAINIFRWWSDNFCNLFTQTTKPF